MKRFAALLLTALLLIGVLGGCAQAGPDQNEMIMVYCVSKAEITGNDPKMTEYSYDEAGNLRTVKERRDGSVATIEQYTYDDNGNLLFYSHPSTGVVAATYDDSGNILTYKHYLGSKIDEDKLRRHESYTYDSQKRLVMVESRTDGIITMRDTWDYNSQGRMIKYSKEYIQDTTTPDIYCYADYDAQGNLICYKIYYNDVLREQDTYSYDRSGRILSCERILDGNVELKEEYTYDAFGRLVHTKSYNLGLYIPEEKPTTLIHVEYSYKYDSKGNLVEQKEIVEDGNSHSVKWTYDESGNLTSYDDSSSITRFTYDEHGNVVKEEWLYDGKVSKTTVYSYVEMRMTRRDAERIQAQQDKIFILPVWDVTPKTVLEQVSF